jgi:hypothetical protein
MAINTEFGRPLPSVVWAPNQPASVRLPTDCALKRLNIRLSGSFKVTYASGSPVFDVYGVFNQLVPTVQVVLDGKDVIKSLSPFQCQQLSYMLMGQVPEQRYSTSASAFTTKIAGTDGRPGAYPATTQYVLDNEQISLFFEDLWAYSYGADVTVLNLRRTTNPELRFQFASYGAMQDPNSSSVSVTYAADQALTIDVTTVEAQDIDVNAVFPIFKEYALSKSYNSQQTGSAIDLNTGNALQGIMFIVRDGDTVKSLSNKALTRVQLRLNGTRVIRDTSFLQLRAENQARRAIAAPTSSGISRLDGTAYMQCMKNGDIRNTIDLSREAGVYQAQVLVDTAPSSGTDAATYTNNVDINLVVQELIIPAELRKK